MAATHRSGCPINLALEVFGDRWTLIVLRDIIFGGKRYYRELLDNDEGISSNILADRLRRLVDAGLLTRADDPTHKQKGVYTLTEASITLLPVLAQIGIWGRQNRPADEALSAIADELGRGGSALWESYMDDLRERHLGSSSR
jgi:DNA-binding HxlR family transcriptional regulator